MELNEWRVRNANRSHTLVFTDHAIIRMTERHIPVASVIDCIENGDLVEIQPGSGAHRHPRAIFFNRGEMLGAAVAEGPELCSVVTVYKVDFRVWMFSGNSLVRRTRSKAVSEDLPSVPA